MPRLRHQSAFIRNAPRVKVAERGPADGEHHCENTFARHPASTEADQAQLGKKERGEVIGAWSSPHIDRRPSQRVISLRRSMGCRTASSMSCGVRRRPTASGGSPTERSRCWRPWSASQVKRSTESDHAQTACVIGAFPFITSVTPPHPEATSKARRLPGTRFPNQVLPPAFRSRRRARPPQMTSLKHPLEHIP
jgi:hypothetical protein